MFSIEIKKDGERIRLYENLEEVELSENRAVAPIYKNGEEKALALAPSFFMQVKIIGTERLTYDKSMEYITSIRKFERNEKALIK